MVAKREEYTNIVDYVAVRGAVSFHKARTILTELSAVMQKALVRGDNLDVPGIFRIEYTSVKEHIYKNRLYGLDEQVADVARNKGLAENEVEKIIRLYYRRMKDLIEIGYHVNVKGIGYVIPKQDEDGVYCDTRVSPVLEKKKSEIADFVVLGDDGTLSIKQLEKEDLRFSIELSDAVVVPYQVIRGTELKLDVVDI